MKDKILKLIDNISNLEDEKKTSLAILFENLEKIILELNKTEINLKDLVFNLFPDIKDENVISLFEEILKLSINEMIFFKSLIREKFKIEDRQEEKKAEATKNQFILFKINNVSEITILKKMSLIRSLQQFVTGLNSTNFSNLISDNVLQVKVSDVTKIKELETIGGSFGAEVKIISE